MSVEKHWSELSTRVREIEMLEGVSSLLGWDQQTMLPPNSGAARGVQMGLMSRLIHERLVDSALADAVDRLAQYSLDPVKQASVRNLRRTIRRSTRVPARLVTELAEAQAAGFETWIAAKGASDFSKFEPHLERLLDLTLERAQAIDPSRAAMDVVLEEYDPGTTVATLQAMFGRLGDELAKLVHAAAERGPVGEVAFAMPLDDQRRVHRRVLDALGFDFATGRLDNAEHPFSVGMHPTDVRITTHLYEEDFLGGLSSTIHECGHALYEQGLPKDLYGTYVGRAASYGLHESQSRFWENTIGRSRPFFSWLERVLADEVPGWNVSAERMYASANRVQPGPIRVHSDEVTYNLHIIVRFEIELAMFEGRLAVRDVPEAWNERYRTLLGVDPANAAQGALQDVHWSGGAFGYFPSYTLGNLYASSMGVLLERDLPLLWTQVECGDFTPILAWLRAKVHQRGHVIEAPEIVREAVGERDSVGDLVDYLWQRHGTLHDLVR